MLLFAKKMDYSSLMQNQPTPNTPPDAPANTPQQQPVPSPTTGTIVKRKKPVRPLLLLALGLIIILVALGLTWHFSHSTSPHTAATHSHTAAQSSSAPASGTDNASLQGDLHSLDATNSIDSTNLNAADTSLNDQQQEVAVPTN